MKRILTCCCILFFVYGKTTGQDIHFSFAEQTPLLLNPAMAGANHEMEGIVNYRNQWSSLGDPYKTTSASFHSRINSAKRKSGNILALGIRLHNDRAGNPGMVSNAASLVIADHVKTGLYSKIGVGMDLGFGQRYIKSADGRWASQYDGTNYNPGSASGETLENFDFRYFDAGIGILYSYEHRTGTLAKTMDRMLNVGLSVYHVNRPNNSFVRENAERLPLRYTFFAHGEMALSGTDMAILPGITIHQQGNFSEYLIGSSIKYTLMDKTRYTGFQKPLSLTAGLFGRLKDAAIVKFAMDWDQYAFGYAFDFNTSKLNRFTNGSGAHEIFLRFSVSEIRPLRR
ncbi:MAG: PorP/SprF family type IX secretion system membrane protein [Bacteroidota bacterium]